MPNDKHRRLRALEALRPPASPADAGRLRERLELMCYLADRQPHESGAEAIGRLLDIPPRDLADAMRSGRFASRWGATMRPLRGLEDAAFVAACEAIRARHLPA